MLDKLFSQYERIVVLDTETTGINCRSEEIIELAAVCIEPQGILEEMDLLIRLSPGKNLPPMIIELTGITNRMLDEQGVEKQEAAERFAAMIREKKTLIVAYNAQFDLCFLYYFLARLGLAEALQGVGMLDAMTVYKDRRPFPHKLQNAIDTYQLSTQNTHRAVDDAKATYELLLAMEQEEDDLEQYINLFGFIAKYGVSGPRISSVTYRPQSYENPVKLYRKG